MEGTIPITHIRLIYDDESDSEDGIDITLLFLRNVQIFVVQSHDQNMQFQCLWMTDYMMVSHFCYLDIHVTNNITDITDFLTNSGWFSHSGKPHGKEALYYVLAKKSGIEYEEFMKIKKAIYMFAFGNEEKIYVGMSDNPSQFVILILSLFLGKADVLHETLAEHFECYGKPRPAIKAIDDELCHHSMASFWQLQIWPLADSENLELEWAKKICSKNSIHTPGGRGLNESVKFTQKSNWVEFKKWLNPKRS